MNTYSPDLLTFLWSMTHENFLVLDTETTGLDRAEICEITIVNSLGDVLLNTLVKTQKPIPPDATRIHGITDEMVAAAPTWADVRRDVIRLTAGNVVAIYNAEYDLRMMLQSDTASSQPFFNYTDVTTYHCAMLAYAEFHGDWNDYRESWRWQKLTDASRQMNLVVKDAHRALGDCLMTLDLIHAMKIQARHSMRNPDNQPDIFEDEGGLSN